MVPVQSPRYSNNISEKDCKKELFGKGVRTPFPKYLKWQKNLRLELLSAWGVLNARSVTTLQRKTNETTHSGWSLKNTAPKTAGILCTARLNN